MVHEISHSNTVIYGDGGCNKNFLIKSMEVNWYCTTGTSVGDMLDRHKTTYIICFIENWWNYGRLPKPIILIVVFLPVNEMILLVCTTRKLDGVLYEILNYSNLTFRVVNTLQWVSCAIPISHNYSRSMLITWSNVIISIKYFLTPAAKGREKGNIFTWIQLLIYY